MDPSAPLTILFNWACGEARQQGMANRLPLSLLLNSMVECREELVHKGRNTAIWVEPLLAKGEVAGCLGLWFQADEPWRESIFLWGQRLGARPGPVVGQMEPMDSSAAAVLAQPTLFPVAGFEAPVSHAATGARPIGDLWCRGSLDCGVR